MTSTLEWPRRLAIIGTGLLGASVGLAARAAVRFFRREARREDEAFGFLRHL